MTIYVGLNKYCMTLYSVYFNLNHFSFLVHIWLHVVIYVTYIQIINNLIYNTQINIWYYDKRSYRVKIIHFQERVLINFDDCRTAT